MTIFDSLVSTFSAPGYCCSKVADTTALLGLQSTRLTLFSNLLVGRLQLYSCTQSAIILIGSLITIFHPLISNVPKKRTCEVNNTACSMSLLANFHGASIFFQNVLYFGLKDTKFDFHLNTASIFQERAPCLNGRVLHCFSKRLVQN